MQSNISVNKMALFVSFPACVNGKTFLDSHGERGGLPRDEIADPPGMAVIPIDIYGFDEGLVSFRTLCDVQSSLVSFAPNRAIAWSPPESQASLETLCLSLAFS